MEVYQGDYPIIIMDKLSGKSLWFEVVAFFFSPLFDELKKTVALDTLTDQQLEQTIQEYINQSIEKYGAKKTSQNLLHPAYAEELSVLTLFEELLHKCKWEPSKTIFQLIYENDKEKAEQLRGAYELFTSEF